MSESTQILGSQNIIRDTKNMLPCFLPLSLTEILLTPTDLVQQPFLRQRLSQSSGQMPLLPLLCSQQRQASIFPSSSFLSTIHSANEVRVSHLRITLIFQLIFHPIPYPSSSKAFEYKDVLLIWGVLFPFPTS